MAFLVRLKRNLIYADGVEFPYGGLVAGLFYRDLVTVSMQVSKKSFSREGLHSLLFEQNGS